MILKCPSCVSLLSVEVRHLRKQEKPIVKCGNCQQTILLRPRVAECGACRENIYYHDYKLNPKNPLMVCPKCNRVNRMPIGKNTFRKLKV